MSLPAATAEALGRTFVNAGTYGFLLAVASRDVFFSVATYLAFWLAILAPIDYAAFIATAPLDADVTLFVASAFLVVPAAATLAAMVGIGFVKLFDIGQLIDVWLTGSGGVSDEDGGEERPPMNRKRIGRNDPCPCGSGKKFKKCHGAAA